jgi:hypothetical protein
MIAQWESAETPGLIVTKSTRLTSAFSGRERSEKN